MKIFFNGEIVKVGNDFISISEMDEDFQEAHRKAVDELIYNYEEPRTSKGEE